MVLSTNSTNADGREIKKCSVGTEWWFPENGTEVAFFFVKSLT